ncbi:hypothetical protein ENSA5_38570 [Enhygromyxa salina]|uniref:Uncharacterized protein n=1 Tax=Enhygromyxa salina TaxID=215803 RepID=A0A2S9XRL4_9BACT|nr:hypothetical protein [Enhygromyxa salina]PRP95504.1 hypothetical protein ENSA5_38570 [Enhygromyxa salina]
MVAPTNAALAALLTGPGRAQSQDEFTLADVTVMSGEHDAELIAYDSRDTLVGVTVQ